MSGDNHFHGIHRGVREPSERDATRVVVLGKGMDIDDRATLIAAVAGKLNDDTKHLGDGLFIATEPDDGYQFRTYGQAPPLSPIALHLLPKSYVAKLRAELDEAVQRLRVEQAKLDFQVVAVDECQPVRPKVRESARQARKRRKRENRAAMSKAREGAYIYDDHLGCHVHRVTR